MAFTSTLAAILLSLLLSNTHALGEPWHYGLHLGHSSCCFYIILSPSSMPLLQLPLLQHASLPTRTARHSSPRCRQPAMLAMVNVGLFPWGFPAPVRYSLMMGATVCISIALPFWNQSCTDCMMTASHNIHRRLQQRCYSRASGWLYGFERASFQHRLSGDQRHV